MEEKYKRDYDVSQVKMDARFVHCRKDAFVTLLSYLAVVFVVWVAAYTLCPEDVSEMTYLLGFPAWYATGALLCFGYAAFAIIWAVKTRKFSLAARGDDQEVEA